MRGFTLVELMVVFGITALLLLLSLGLWGGTTARAGVEESAERVRTLMEDARGRTLARVQGASYGVRIESDRATLFPVPYVPLAASNTVYVLPTGVTISSVALAGGGIDVLFALFTGETPTDGTITLERMSNSSLRRMVRIFSSGYAEVE